MTRFAFFPVLFALAACQGVTPTGQHLYDQHCADCHGADLRGGGPLARDLPHGATDLTTLAAHNGGVFPMQDVIVQIHGYPGRSHFGAMPEYQAHKSERSAIVVLPDGTRRPLSLEILRIAQYLEANQK